MTAGLTTRRWRRSAPGGTGLLATGSVADPLRLPGPVPRPERTEHRREPGRAGPATTWSALCLGAPPGGADLHRRRSAGIGSRSSW
ncbi:hypothetical protein HBB16_16145 [Pseudonocardia sp. MCCB 268]|nr:hypothetical protein [Pseudonocardia cytotoxica]